MCRSTPIFCITLLYCKRQDIPFYKKSLFIHTFCFASYMYNLRFRNNPTKAAKLSLHHFYRVQSVCCKSADQFHRQDADEIICNLTTVIQNKRTKCHKIKTENVVDNPKSTEYCHFTSIINPLFLL